MTMVRMQAQRSSLRPIFFRLLPIFAAVLFVLALLTQSRFALAEKTRFDLTQLKAPAGFHISVFAEVDGPRMMIFSPGGTCWSVSRERAR